jgi:uroporphyrinogen-III decarboxylase
VIQVFDSWAGSLSPEGTQFPCFTGTKVQMLTQKVSPEDYDLFALPYQKIVIKAIKVH